MLQWMGGSRRKVLTSRKSTHKRQKQYFEQRKRQQQQQTTGLENYADGRHSCSQRHGNKRSLDILSFSNLSTVAQEHKSSCPIGRDSPEDDTFTLNYHNAHQPPAIRTSKAIVADHFETNEASMPSREQLETVYQKKLLASPPDYKEEITGNGDKLKLATQCQISVIDLLDDDGERGNAEEIAVHAQESHVAFSVEGLGKVETETPIHSPCRSFLNSFSSHEKPRRQTSTSQNFKRSLDDFESQMDVMVDDVNFSLYDDYVEQSFCSGDKMDLFGNPKRKFTNCRKSSPFNRNDNSLKDILGDDLLLYNTKDSTENIWNVGSTFLDNRVDNIGEYELYCKSRTDVRDAGYANFFTINDRWRRDFTFQGYSIQKKRASTQEMENFNIADPYSNYAKHQKSEYLQDFEISDLSWCSTIGLHHNVKDASNQTARACFVGEHARESSSLPSEESCSSSAVRGDDIKTSPPRKQETKIQDLDGWFHENNCYMENICGNERNSRSGNISHLQQGENINRLEKFMRTTEASSTPARFRISTFDDSSFFQTSGMIRHASSGPSAWSKDVLDVTQDPKLIFGSPLERSTNLAAELSPCVGVTSGKNYFCHTFSHIYSHETPISHNMEFEPNMEKLSQDSKGNRAPGSLHTLSYLGPEQESLDKDRERNCDIPSDGGGNIELQMKISDGSKGLSSKMESPSVYPNRTPETKDSMKGMNSSDLAEETSSSGEIPSISGSIQRSTENKLCQGDT